MLPLGGEYVPAHTAAPGAIKLRSDWLSISARVSVSAFAQGHAGTVRSS